ncbi:hypothetical protein [Clostridium sp.]|uniref:hypothetical protein n=1 Tax=Clostridium sp. TaxID=1506 RepID=UPI00261C9513|nr:hypothetical protein [Clostridium sp.]
MPSMQDMIDELNDIECPSCPPVDQCCSGFGNCGNFGCGFGSWIWILLILFYAGQGGNAGYGGNSGCCCNTNSNCCCGNTGNYGNGGLFGGLGNCGGGYLFLLVILFLCNGSFGCGNFGNCGNNVASCGNLI